MAGLRVRRRRWHPVSNPLSPSPQPHTCPLPKIQLPQESRKRKKRRLEELQRSVLFLTHENHQLREQNELLRQMLMTRLPPSAAAAVNAAMEAQQKQRAADGSVSAAAAGAGAAAVAGAVAGADQTNTAPLVSGLLSAVCVHV